MSKKELQSPEWGPCNPRSMIGGNVIQFLRLDKISGYKSVLDQLLEAWETQESFSNERIRENVDTIIGAAYDTSTRAMTFCLLLTGSHPDVQAKIFQEYVFT